MDVSQSVPGVWRLRAQRRFLGHGLLCVGAMKDDDAEERLGIGLIVVAAFVAALVLWGIWSAVP